MKDCAGVAALNNADRERRKYMIIKQAELETVCGITSKLPENEWPEVAFAGKSNVNIMNLEVALWKSQRHYSSMQLAC